jgi:hypothetical protein
MSIDKESDGLPQVDVHRRTTKVNLSMVAAIVVFFLLAAAVAFWVSRQQATPPRDPATSSRSE